jgi:hypothetical protein
MRATPRHTRVIISNRPPPHARNPRCVLRRGFRFVCVPSIEMPTKRGFGRHVSRGDFVRWGKVAASYVAFVFAPRKRDVS